MSRLNEVKILLLSELSDESQSIPILISTWLPQENTTSLYGLKVALNVRLQNFSNPIIILTFYKTNTLGNYDKSGITMLPGTYLIQLPCDRNIISNAVSNSIKIEGNELQAFRKKAFIKEYELLIKYLKHGEQHDFINNVTGPLRAACIMTKYQPETIYNVHKQVERINKYFSSSGITDFLKTYSYFENGKAEIENVISFQSIIFFEGLRSFIKVLNNDIQNMDECINAIDNLNQKTSFLKNL